MKKPPLLQKAFRPFPGKVYPINLRGLLQQIKIVLRLSRGIHHNAPLFYPLLPRAEKVARALGHLQ